MLVVAHVVFQVVLMVVYHLGQPSSVFLNWLAPLNFYVLVGQLFVLACLGALGPGAAAKRLSLSFQVAVLLVIPLGISWYKLWFLVGAGFSINWGVLVAMAYLTYRLRGWRIQHRGDDHPIESPTLIQFRIRHLLALTTLVAVLALLVPSIVPYVQFGAALPHSAVFAFVLASMLLPITRVVLRDHCPTPMVIVIAIWTLVIPVTHCVFALSFGGPSAILGVGAPYLYLLAVCLGTLLVIRTLGWRLMRPSASSPISI